MDTFFDEVISVESIECDSLRYDITVEDNHNFFANGILVHNCQNLVSEVFNEARLNMPVEVTMKLDGSSCTVYHNNGDVGVCSRNLELKINEENAGNAFIRAATESNMFEALKKLGRNLAVQGEIMGPGIQGNRENFKDLKLFVYNIFDIDKQEFVNPDERAAMFDQLETTAHHVPEIANNVTLNSLGMATLDDMLTLVDNSRSINHDVAEGYVFKFDDGFQFKCISNKFLLSEK